VTTIDRSSRRARRRVAIDFVIDHFGSDCFTTHDIWFHARKMIRDGVVFPRYTKRSYESIGRIDTLGQMLRAMPNIQFEAHMDTYNGSIGRSRRRERTTLWIRLN
jgi:hypothetical protein